MREIKCRGFRNFKGNALYPPDKRWIYGYYYFNAGEHWIKNKADMAQTFVVEEDSVGEFTGLKGIFEGDIVNVTFPNGGRVRAVIEWHQLAWYYQELFALDNSLNSQALSNCPYPSYMPLHCVGYGFEIIGNTYENPKLLEGTK